MRNQVLMATRTPEEQQVHLVDLYQRKGIYRSVPIEQAFTWIERVLRRASQAEVHYHARIVWKDAYLEDLRQSTRQSDRQAADRGEAPTDLYVGHMPHLILNLDTYCERIGERALMFVDQHERTRHLDSESGGSSSSSHRTSPG